jgi:hypothetical protein
MRSFLQRLAVAACAVSLLATSVCAQEFDEIRNSVRNGTPPDEESEPRKRRHSRSSDHCNDDEDSGFGDLFGGMLLVGLASPYWLPHFITGDDLVVWGAVVAAPYDDAEYSLVTQTMVDDLPPLFGRLQLDYTTNFGDQDKVGGQVLIETPWRLGIDTTWTSWWERGPGPTDSLQLGDFNIVYRFAQAEDIQFRSGLGFNWISDDVGSDFGFNFTYGVDYFPRRPWVISTTFDLGTLGDAGLFHNQTTVGIALKQFEIFTGFDYYRIGGGELSGWTNGVRWRF